MTFVDEALSCASSQAQSQYMRDIALRDIADSRGRGCTCGGRIENTLCDSTTPMERTLNQLVGEVVQPAMCLRDVRHFQI